MLNNEELKKLCLNLMKADSEEQVIDLLSEKGYWDDPEVWRYYGDRESNFNTINNQMAQSDAALVEKIINSVDAHLMNKDMLNDLSDEKEYLRKPKTVRQAVAMFYDNVDDPENQAAGRISEWTDKRRTEIARGIAVYTTGAKDKPCFNVADNGEGQSPETMPETILSLDKKIKLRIPFVQGKFHMGGSGVLMFCGKHGLQFVLSKRNPALINNRNASKEDRMWGFTVVRRVFPEGSRRSSVFTYLAPIETSNSTNGNGILRFTSDNMPIFPERKKPYAVGSGWGTFIKLYEYDTRYRSNMIRKDGMKERLDILLPEIALPARLHECRKGYKGHEGSFDTTLTGLSVRLDDDKAQNLEPEFPSSGLIRAAGENIKVTIYAFKKGKASTYKAKEGVLFTLNGQTHGALSETFFRRSRRVGLGYIADSILVILDCSNFSAKTVEDLFKNSRDRLSGSSLAKEIEKRLERMIREHPGLRKLNQRRREEDIRERLDDSKPLSDLLETILKKSPTLSNMFLKGLKVPTAFKSKSVKEGETEFQGERFPTFFKFKGLKYGRELTKQCHINMRARIAFETDAENNYLSRDIEPGEFSLKQVQEDGSEVLIDDYALNLQDGIANLTITLPKECEIGDCLYFCAEVNDNDPGRIEPFLNQLRIWVRDETESNKNIGNRRKPPTSNTGDDRQIAAGIQLPNIYQVEEKDWESSKFDKFTALKIIQSDIDNLSSENGDHHAIYDFYVNVDNVYLVNEIKASKKKDLRITKARFEYALVLLALGIIHQDTLEQDVDKELESEETLLENRIESYSRAVAPFIVPMIESLGDLELEDIDTLY